MTPAAARVRDAAHLRLAHPSPGGRRRHGAGRRPADRARGAGRGCGRDRDRAGHRQRAGAAGRRAGERLGHRHRLRQPRPGGGGAGHGCRACGPIPPPSATSRRCAASGTTSWSRRSARWRRGLTGVGRLAEPSSIVEAVEGLFARAGDLEGLHVVVSAGGTREPLDPVRFIGNRSSGKMGVAIAEAARDRGASVTLIAGTISAPAPRGVTVQDATTAAAMREAVLRAAPAADILIMAAAVADFAPKAPIGHQDQARRRPAGRAGAEPGHRGRGGRDARRPAPLPGRLRRRER